MHAHTKSMGFPGGAVVKNPPANAVDEDSIPGREDPWRKKWKPTLVFCLGNPMDRGAWWATVYRVAKESDHNLVTKQQQQQPRANF